jgi:Ca-activated chloride channel family protein
MADPRNRSRSLVACALLALTAAGGVTARMLQQGGGSSGSQGQTTLQFSAPGGGPVSFGGRLDRGSVLAHGDGLVKMELVLKAQERPGLTSFRVPTDLVVILDRSGSMSGEPLHHAKGAVRELIASLGSGDRFALVTYSSGAALAIPLSKATSSARAGWLPAVERIQATGGTNMARGLDLAMDTVARVKTRGRAPRVILISDGHANEGDHSLEGLRARAARAVAGEYVVSTVGVGLGFDEHLMAQLADAGTGNFYYLRHSEDLGAIFAGEFESARETVAQALKVQIVPGEGVEVVDAAGYPLDRQGQAVFFRPGSLFSGQERRVWVTLRAPAGEEGETGLGRFSLSYRDAADPDAGRSVLAFSEVPVVACVKGEEEFLASVDQAAFEDQLAVDELNSLKQSVSRSVQAGDRANALREIEAFERKSRGFLQYWKKDEKDSQAYREAEQLRRRLGAAFAPQAEPEARNQLGKELSEEGLDGRRAGSKKVKVQ